MQFLVGFSLTLFTLWHSVNIGIHQVISTCCFIQVMYAAGNLAIRSSALYGTIYHQRSFVQETRGLCYITRTCHYLFDFYCQFCDAYYSKLVKTLGWDLIWPTNLLYPYFCWISMTFSVIRILILLVRLTRTWASWSGLEISSLNLPMSIIWKTFDVSRVRVRVVGVGPNY